MNLDFHYYATYCAAVLAGYSHEEGLEICYAAQFTDACTETLLQTIGAPVSAATTQMGTELANAPMTHIGKHHVTRIWSSFHFLPYDLKASLPHRGRSYMNKYRLICRPNGSLVTDTVEQAKKGGTLQAVGVAAHIVADTWAHMYFAGTPSLVINNTTDWFYELREENGKEIRKKLTFRNSLGAADDIEEGIYTQTLSQKKEDTIMNLGHGRAGHLPDYSFIRYTYLPAWGGYEPVVKNNPDDYYHAFCQLIHVMKYLRGSCDTFRRDFYDEETVAPWKDQITAILKKRQLDSSEDWNALAEQISGKRLPDFTPELYKKQYVDAPTAEEKDQTPAGKYFIAAMAQKSMVTNRIYSSGSLLAGISIKYDNTKFKGIREFEKLLHVFHKKEDNDGNR
ncbi:MAG: hypothetical protein HUJ73_02870 [Eubacterium sp.]|nr:hypothetical protein [Eubacterium sp.]